MTKTVDELKQQAKDKNITHYPVRECSICGYTLEYLIRNDQVYYDSGCDCVSHSAGPQLRSWEDLAECYNRNQPENNPDIKPAFLIELDKTWQFGYEQEKIKDIPVT